MTKTRRTGVSTLCVAAIACIGLGVAAGPARAANRCVGGAGCFSTIQAALDAANDGDTIQIAPGTFAGGITIAKSVRVVGAGAGATIIQGGGPVVTIGTEFAATEPTVSIGGVTITGGVNSSVPDPAVEFGGGVRIPQAGSSPPFKTGATVTIRDSAITGNRVFSQQLLPPGFCGPEDCSFASGGGISNDGDLTLINTRVTDNQAGGTASQSIFPSGGGISSSQRGKLMLRHSFVTGNRVTGSSSIGGEANAGGINSNGPLTIEDSVVSDNAVEVSSSRSEVVALAGGIHAGDCCGAGAATITRTIVRGNSVTATNVTGDAISFAGGIASDGSLVLNDSLVDRNRVTASVAAASAGSAFSDGGGLEVNGTATITSTLISGNTVSSVGAAGMAVAQGGGLANTGQTTLQRTLVLGNSASASGPSSVAQGGGIWNGTFGGPPPTLAIADSVVFANRLVASTGGSRQGGGLYTDFPVSLTRTVIAGNSPDQCHGC